MKTQPQIIMTDKDYGRLSQLLEQENSEETEKLWDEISRAQIVSQTEVPSDVVTMNSLVRVKDIQSGKERDLIIVYPNQADVYLGKISILVPIGIALIGLRVGQSIDLVVPNGKTKRVQVTEVSYQPEAHKAYSL
jgi:regulator of nucleoside diphosphate kinase